MTVGFGTLRWAENIYALHAGVHHEETEFNLEQKSVGHAKGARYAVPQ